MATLHYPFLVEYLHRRPCLILEEGSCLTLVSSVLKDSWRESQEVGLGNPLHNGHEKKEKGLFQSNYGLMKFSTTAMCGCMTWQTQLKLH